MRSIVHYPNLILEIPCKEVTDFGPYIHELLNDMLTVMIQLNGLGIAANQVGESLRVIITRDEQNRITRMINPVIKEHDKSVIMLNEGCLSVPGQNLDVLRPETVTVEYQDMFGEKHLGYFHGIEARAVLHEMDHLNGIMFFQKVSRQQRKKMLSIYKKR